VEEGEKGGYGAEEEDVGVLSGLRWDSVELQERDWD
jgi:hypothetical protein